MTTKVYSSHGASDTISFTPFPVGSWCITVNDVPTILEIPSKNVLTTLYTFFYTYNVSLTITDGKIIIFNKSENLLKVGIEYLTSVSDDYIFHSYGINNSEEIVRQLSNQKILSINFYLAPSGVSFFKDSTIFEPSSFFEEPDDSCFYPIYNYLNQNKTKLNNIDYLQNTSVSLHFKNLNEQDTVIKIYKLEGLSEFQEFNINVNNPTNIVFPSIFQACLRGNTCKPMYLLPVYNLECSLENIYILNPIENGSISVEDIYELNPVKISDISLEEAYTLLPVMKEEALLEDTVKIIQFFGIESVNFVNPENFVIIKESKSIENFTSYPL